MHCTTDRQAAAPLLVLPRRFATESAREEARMFCDELMAARRMGGAKRYPSIASYGDDGFRRLNPSYVLLPIAA
jgi:hypothetical protein